MRHGIILTVFTDDPRGPGARATSHRTSSALGFHRGFTIPAQSSVTLHLIGPRVGPTLWKERSAT